MSEFGEMAQALHVVKTARKHEPLMSNRVFGVVVDGPLQGKHFRTLFIISPFISVRYVSIGFFDHTVNEAP